MFSRMTKSSASQIKATRTSLESFARSIFLVGLGVALPLIASAWRSAPVEPAPTPDAGTQATSSASPRSAVEVDPRRTREVQVVERVRSAIVSIDVKRRDGTSTAGCGVIVNARGFLLSNYHVVRDARSIRVQIAGKDPWPARVVALSRANDLALIELESGRRSDFPYVTMGSSERVLAGETVLAIGSPYGFKHTVSRGVVSAVRRTVRLPSGAEYHDFIQTDAAINPGNSGGGLIDLSGRLIGVNSAIFNAGWGIAFAIPVDRIKDLLDSYVRKEHSLGLVVESTPGGLAVREVAKGGEASNAGVKPGDLLMYGNGQPLREQIDLVTASLGATKLNPLRLHLDRSGRELAIDVRGISVLWSRLGIRSTDDELREGTGRPLAGVRVDELDPEGRAHSADLQAGDVIVGATVVGANAAGRAAAGVEEKGGARTAKPSPATYRIHTGDDILLVLERYPTQTLALQIIRGSKRRQVTIP